MTYLYQFVGGPWNGMTITEQEARKEAAGISPDLSPIRAQGGLVHRPELDNQPTFKGYLGPMWDGLRWIHGGKLSYEWETPAAVKANQSPYAVIRYETQAVYDLLSR